MEINYIILVHKNPEQLRRLVGKLNTTNSFFYIHVDKNVEIKPFIIELSIIKNACFLENREKGTWGDVGIVKATINALQQITKEQRTGYCVLLSGQDYPIKSNAKIEAFLSKNYGTNFIETFPIPIEDWSEGGLERIQHYKFNLSDKRLDYILLPSILSKDFYKQLKQNLRRIKALLKRKIIPFSILRKRNFPSYIKPFGGSQWWAIPIEMATKILWFLEQHRDYLDYHKSTLLADEIFFHSIIRHLACSDNNVIIKPSITYVNWKKPGVPLPVTFDTNDFEELINQPDEKLLARKFDINIDDKILNLIDSHQHN